MPKRSLSDQLEQHIQVLVAATAPGIAPTDPELEQLLSIAADLRHLPRPTFKEKLKQELIRRATMSSQTVNPIREGFHTITPYIVVQDPMALNEFIGKTFGAIGVNRGIGSAGGYHFEVQIGDSMLMFGGGGTSTVTPMPTALHVYVEDADAAYERAIAAGATSLGGPVDQDYGDREAGVTDPTGNRWYIATHKQAGPDKFIPEGLRTVTLAFHPKGAENFIELLRRGFGAEELEMYKTAAGAVMHAKMRIGDSVVEVGEAHGPFQPMPTAIFLYVDDADAAYSRAMQAGCTSLWAPADQPYGDRVGGVQDPSGNHWYPATHIGGGSE